MTLRSINPATGETMNSYEPHTPAQVDSALARAALAFRHHRQTSIEERAALMNSAADLLESSKQKWAELLTAEVGKTLKSAIGEVEKCALVCRHYASHTAEYLADEPMTSSASRSYVRHLPLGPILAVMPWNFPFWQVFRFAAPALMAGNVGLLKHASNVPASALAIEEIFRLAGFEEGVFQTLLVGSHAVEGILADPRVRAATVTGSEGAGAAVASVAGRHHKKTVLELGGSDPFIVLPSADIGAAVKAAVGARIINNGQSCIAAKRFIVHSAIYDQFREAFVAGFEALKVGDPMNPDTDIGPLATPQIKSDLTGQVDASVAKGARRLCGAQPMSGVGNFYRPGILDSVPRESPAWSEELFGPVAMLFRVDGVDEAIELANDTRFGLGSSVWTTDEAEIKAAVNGLEAGCTFVNAIVASDPRLPFGGVKSSGYGRELARDGMLEFMNRKTVSIK
jgi:succinate-semialdehyde dehydrogenase/glutarate-semialdehyde dehydrogenase